MKNKELIYYFNGLKNLKLTGVKINYMIFKNLEKMKPEVETLEKVIKPSEEFLTYEQSRLDLLNKYGKRDESGEVIVDKNVVVLEDKEGFETEFVLLKSEYQKALDDRTVQVKDYLELLEQDAKEIQFTQLDIEDVPTSISTQEMEFIFPFIKEK